MEAEPTPPAVPPPAEEAADEDEAFAVGEDGELGGGFRVIDDLDDDAQGPPMSSDDDDDVAVDDAEPSASGAVNGGDSMTNAAEDSWHCFEGHGEGVMTVAWNPKKQSMVATGGIDDKGFIFQAGQEAFEASGQATHELGGHEDTVTKVAFSADGIYLASAGMDGKTQVYSAETGELVKSLEGPGEAIEFMCWHPRGNVVLAGSEDTTVWMWLAVTGDCMQVFSGHGAPVTAGCFTPDGKHVVTAAYDGQLRVWNPKTGEAIHTIHEHPFHTAGITCLAIHHRSEIVLTGDEEGGLRISNVQNGRVVGSLEGHNNEASVEAVGFCKQLPLAASVDTDGDMIIWDLEHMTQRSRCKHGEALTCLAVHPTAPYVATGCVDGVVRVWDLRTGTTAATFRGHGDAIQALEFNADGTQLLSGSDDHTARMFRMPTLA